MSITLKSKWLRRIRSGQLFTLHKGKTLVGRCKLYFTGKRSAILGDLIIYKRFRGKGHGSVLLSQVLKSDLNYMLWVSEANIAAQNLYTKHGFKQIGVETDRIIMFRKRFKK